MWCGRIQAHLKTLVSTHSGGGKKGPGPVYPPSAREDNKIWLPLTWMVRSGTEDWWELPLKWRSDLTWLTEGLKTAVPVQPHHVFTFYVTPVHYKDQSNQLTVHHIIMSHEYIVSFIKPAINDIYFMSLGGSRNKLLTQHWHVITLQVHVMNLLTKVCY